MSDPVGSRKPEPNFIPAALQSNETCLIDEGEKPKAASKVATQNQVSRADSEKARIEREHAAQETRVGEQQIFKEVASLAPGDFTEASVAMGVKSGFKAGAKGDVKVERQEDGTYMVTLKGEANVGIGSNGTVAAGMGARFHLQTAEGVANLVQAYTENGIAGAVGKSTFLGVVGEAALEYRSAKVISEHAQRDMVAVSVKVDVSATLDNQKGKIPTVDSITPAVTTSLAATVSAEVDYARGEIRFSQALKGKAAAELGGAIAKVTNLGAEASVEAKLEGTLKLTDQMKRDLKSGKVSIEELYRQTQMSLKLTAERSIAAEALGMGGRVTQKIEATLPLSLMPALLTDATERNRILEETTLRARVYTSTGGIKVGHDLEVVSGHVEARTNRIAGDFNLSAGDAARWLQEKTENIVAAEREWLMRVTSGWVQEAIKP